MHKERGEREANERRRGRAGRALEQEKERGRENRQRGVREGGKKTERGPWRAEKQEGREEHHVSKMTETGK